MLEKQSSYNFFGWFFIIINTCTCTGHVHVVHVERFFNDVLHMHTPPSSGDGSSASQQSEEPRSPQAMAQAVRVHEEINKVMYFA